MKYAAKYKYKTWINICKEIHFDNKTKNVFPPPYMTKEMKCYDTLNFKLKQKITNNVGVGFKLKVISLSSFKRGDATLVSSLSFYSWLPSKIIKIQKSVPYLPILDFLQKESANQFLPRGSSSISSAFLSNFRPTFIRQHWSPSRQVCHCLSIGSFV